MSDLRITEADFSKLPDEALVDALRKDWSPGHEALLIKEALARLLTKMTENEWGDNEIGD
jgi:hypothetical protein